VDSPRSPGQPDLDFRGVVAISDTTAYLMSSGEGDKSRIYKTADGGATWELQFTDVNKAFFLDSVACVSEIKCFALVIRSMENFSSCRPLMATVGIPCPRKIFLAHFPKKVLSPQAIPICS